MLTYATLGNLVVYPTPGCNVPTVACQCNTPAQASCEADRLNAEQAEKEAAIQLERKLCGLYAMSNDLSGAI